MRWWIAVVVAGAAALGGVAWWFLRPDQTPPPAVVDPPPDFGRHSDPMVEGYLRGLVATAVTTPRDAAARGTLAMAYDANGCTVLAEQTYGQAMALDSTDPRWPYLRGVLRHREGIAGAMDDLGDATRLAPTSAAAWWRRGYAHLDDGAITDAESDFAKALTIKDSDPAAMTGLARVRLEQGRENESIQLLERVLHLHGTASFAPYVHGLLGSVYRRTGDMTRAQSHLARQRGGSPSWPDPWVQERSQLVRKLERVMAAAEASIDAGRFDQGIGMLEELREYHPDNTAVLIALHGAHAANGDLNTAMRLLQQVPTDSSDYAVARLNMAIITLRTNQIDQSMEHVRAAIQRQPTLSRAHEHLAKLLTTRGDWVAAAAAMDEAFRYGLVGDESRILAGRICLNASRVPDAGGHFEHILQRNPDNASAWAGLAVVQVALRRTDQAQVAIRNAERLGNLDPTDEQLLNMARQALRQGG